MSECSNAFTQSTFVWIANAVKGHAMFSKERTTGCEIVKSYFNIYNFKGKGWKASWSRITIKYSDILAKILNWM